MPDLDPIRKLASSKPRRKTSKPRQVAVPITVTLDSNRLAWLSLAARVRGWSLEEYATSLLHNASLDYQQDHFPDSDPGDCPSDVD
jgi:hypothetical protein